MMNNTMHKTTNYIHEKRIIQLLANIKFNLLPHLHSWWDQTQNEKLQIGFHYGSDPPALQSNEISHTKNILIWNRANN
jgi:hypothetical protein